MERKIAGIFLRTKNIYDNRRKPVTRRTSKTTVLMSMIATTDTSVNINEWWNVQ